MIDLEKLKEISEWEDTKVTYAEGVDALNLIEDVLTDPGFDGPGKRNDSGVNLAIGLHVLGCKDVVGWYQEWSNDPDAQFVKKLEVVEPYLEDWGPKDKEGEALVYAIK